MSLPDRNAFSAKLSAPLPSETSTVRLATVEVIFEKSDSLPLLNTKRPAWMYNTGYCTATIKLICMDWWGRVWCKKCG